MRADGSGVVGVVVSVRLGGMIGGVRCDVDAAVSAAFEVVAPSVAEALEEVEDSLLEAVGLEVVEGVEEVGGVWRSEWRGVRSESLPGPWIAALAGMTVCGGGSFDRLRMNGLMGAGETPALRFCGGGRLVFGFCTGGLAEAAVEELTGCGHSVVGPERSKISHHDAYEEANDGASVVGVLANQPGELSVELGWARGPVAVAVGAGFLGVVVYEVGCVFVAVCGQEPCGL